MSLPTLLSASAALLSALTIISDIYSRRVPNIWLLCALTIGFIASMWAWMTGTGGPPWPALLGLFIGIIVLLPFHIFGWMGAGDVKFFAVLGFLLSAKALLPIWLIASLIAGAHAALILLSRHGIVLIVPAWGATQNWFSTSAFGRHMSAARQGRKGLPYAAWLGVGALITIFNPELMHW